MDTNIKLVQIIVSLLKQFDIHHIVISPGTRHYPLVHCVETDSFFTCYSVVDERSAGFFALGLSEAMDKPVCVTCTSSTASCNYMPAMQEAYDRKIQLIALTSDKARYHRFHGVSQVIDQVDMYHPYCRCSVDVPIVNNSDDYWYANRRVNEALLEVNHHGKGPVQINFLESVGLEHEAKFIEGDVPVTRKINRIEQPDWKYWASKLSVKKKVLVVCGQYYQKDRALSPYLSRFASKYNVAISYDGFSNVHGNDFILSPTVLGQINSDNLKKIMPDLIITYGTKAFSNIISIFCDKGIEHWDINPEGRLYDSTMSLNTIFESEPVDFFEGLSTWGKRNDGIYLSQWKKIGDEVLFEPDIFSNFYVAKHILDAMPGKALVHASVLNSMKFVNLVRLHDAVDSFGNIGTDGIDGALSTFLGQAELSEDFALLIVGDLSFLYDLNAASYALKNNIRILLINNHAGSEFHYNIGIKKIPTIDMHIAAGHHTDIKQAIGLTSFRYMSAHTKPEFEKCVDGFMARSDKPILFEVFTDPEVDAQTLISIYARNQKQTRKEKIKSLIRSTLGEKVIRMLKS